MLTSVKHAQILSTLNRHIIAGVVYESVDKDMFNFVLKPEEPVLLPQIHCKQCHYTGRVSSPKSPSQCPNQKGWTDDQGVVHPKCNHRRMWYLWPESFNPNTCKCEACKIIWQMEQKKLEVFGEAPPVQKKRGPRFKSQKS